LGTIFRVTFTVFYRRIWNIVGKYSILCCDTRHSIRTALLVITLELVERARFQPKTALGF
jgi:hypothetical protein